MSVVYVGIPFVRIICFSCIFFTPEIIIKQIYNYLISLRKLNLFDGSSFT